jgi:rhodanese-related sulfurtransferase
VRESDELSDGNIENSMHLPLGSIIRNARQGKLDEYKDKKIVTYVTLVIEEILQQKN